MKKFKTVKKIFDRISPSTSRPQEQTPIAKGKRPVVSHPQQSPAPTNTAYRRDVEFVEKAAQARGNSNTPPGTPPVLPTPENKRKRDAPTPFRLVEDHSHREHSCQKSSHLSLNSSQKRDSQTYDVDPHPIRKAESESEQD